jgi:glycosyltransferase involved in cell wall biosynthesis
VSRPRVVVLRGHSANVAELRPWELLADGYDVEVVTTTRADQPLDGLRIPSAVARTRRGALPPGRIWTLATSVVGDRYRELGDLLRGADIVHSAELVPWFAAQPAALKRELGFKLVLTVWELIPFVHSSRSRRARVASATTLAAADLFLPTTERARRCLLLEGAASARIMVAPPGIDVSRFSPGEPPREHLLVSPGRLVWEKGHQDVLRALAALRAGIVDGTPPRLLVVGAGRDERRLKALAWELGLASDVEWRRSVPYEEMPGIYAQASAVVLASLPTPTWEEQFGMVLAEALAAGVPILASESGAIPEVLDGAGTLFAPGDWPGLARRLAELTAAPPRRESHDDLARRYSTEAAAARLADAYARVLEGRPAA